MSKGSSGRREVGSGRLTGVLLLEREVEGVGGGGVGSAVGGIGAHNWERGWLCSERVVQKSFN